VKSGKEIYIIFLSVFFFVSSKEALAWQAQENFDEPLKIGLIISDSTAVEARNGAELAVKRVNENGGINGRPVQLITRSMEGAWGSGSKEVVDLVFKENIWAILGSHDSRNAHLVEQVIAKTRVVFLSAWASDPTLSQAYVPWYFSAVPNDNQQAKVLVKEIYDRRKIEKAIAILDDSYDSKMAWKSMAREISIAEKHVPKAFFLDGTDKNFSNLISEIKSNKTAALILMGQPSRAWALIDQIRQQSINNLVFGNISILGEGVFLHRKLKDYNDVVFIGSKKWLENKPSSFRNQYVAAYGHIPGAAAAFAFDGMNVLMQALEISKLDREKMKEAMMKIQVQGCTGNPRFNERGLLKANPELIEIKEGKLVLLEH